MSALVPSIQTQFQIQWLLPVDSELHHLLIEIHKTAQFSPHVLDCIEADLDLHGAMKKLVREADQRFNDGQTADIPGLSIALRECKAGDVRLEGGRPRLTAYVVFLFTMLRGYLGGCKDQGARLQLEESITLRLWLGNLGLDLPGASTLSDNLNAVSNPTRDAIHKAQLSYILQEKLDDFSTQYIDSTAVKGNAERPTDSGLIDTLVARICRTGQKLDRYGLPNMKAEGLGKLEEDVRHLHKEIGFCSGKPKSEGKLKRLYFQLLRRARRACGRFGRELAEIQGACTGNKSLPPSQRLRALEVVALIGDDIEAIGKVADACHKRVFLGEKVPATEKIVSLSDEDAAFIVKGNWNTEVGYRPQVGRSGNGFVSSLIVPRGNAADSGQLVDMVVEHWERSTVLPSNVSVDDGYSSKQAREDLLKTGVEVVSVSGAKGKKITPPEQWKSAAYRDARAGRSAIESLVFTLKHGYDFGAMTRRGVENVYAALMEKIIAYNFIHALRLRKRRQKEETAMPMAA